MNGARGLAILVTMGLVGIIGLVTYPYIHNVLDDVATTGFPPLLTSVMTGLPYALLGVIIYAVISAKYTKQ